MVAMALVDDAFPLKRKQAKIIFLLVCFLLASDHATGFGSLPTQRMATRTTRTQNDGACPRALKSTRQQFPDTSTTTLSSEPDVPLQFDRRLLEKRYEKQMS